IKEVELHPAIELQAAAPLEGPEAGQPRSHPQAATLPGLVVFHFRGQRRSWSHQGHVSAQNIPELRELIQAQHSHPMPYDRAPGVVLHFEDWTIDLVQLLQMRQKLVCVCNHGTKLQQRESTSSQAAAGLAIKDR